MIGTTSTRLLLAALALGLGLPAMATTVYRSVDERGVVTFSDSPPAGDEAVETLEIKTPAPQPDGLQQQRLEEMRATTDRMAADRMAREKHRAELRQLERETERPEQEETQFSERRYLDYPVRYPLWPHYRPLPEHPITRPPLRPEHPLPVQPQPRYNEYPASLIRRHYDPKVRAAISR